MTRDESLDRAFALNDAAGRAIKEGKYLHAAKLLTEAATYSPSEAGKKALYARALEAAAMVNDPWDRVVDIVSDQR